MLLKTIKGITIKQLTTLFNNYKSVEDIFNADYDTLLSYNIKSSVAKNILDRKYDTDYVDYQYSLAEKHNAKIIGIDDKEYPPFLKQINDAPYYFYVKGSLDCLKKPTISLVGSRRSSKHGLEFAETLASDLAMAGFTVISGFAAGIDIAAHLGAIKNGYTAAIIGSGLNDIYPSKHVKYIDDVVNNGCIITEYDFDVPPLPYNFPQRNRIIAALSLGVVVVEAKLKSGSLITAKLARRYNKQLFAVPHFPSFSGSASNQLIKDGAIPIESYKDIVKEYKDLIKKVKIKTKNTATIEFADEIEENICNIISEAPYSADEVSSKLNIDICQILMYLTNLELSGIVTKDDNGRYIFLGGKSG